MKIHRSAFAIGGAVCFFALLFLWTIPTFATEPEEHPPTSEEEEPPAPPPEPGRMIDRIRQGLGGITYGPGQGPGGAPPKTGVYYPAGGGPAVLLPSCTCEGLGCSCGKQLACGGALEEAGKKVCPGMKICACRGEGCGCKVSFACGGATQVSAEEAGKPAAAAKGSPEPSEEELRRIRQEYEEKLTRTRAAHEGVEAADAEVRGLEQGLERARQRVAEMEEIESRDPDIQAARRAQERHPLGTVPPVELTGARVAREAAARAEADLEEGQRRAEGARGQVTRESIELAEARQRLAEAEPLPGETAPSPELDALNEARRQADEAQQRAWQERGDVRHYEQEADRLRGEADYQRARGNHDGAGRAEAEADALDLRLREEEAEAIRARGEAAEARARAAQEEASFLRREHDQLDARSRDLRRQVREAIRAGRPQNEVRDLMEEADMADARGGVSGNRVRDAEALARAARDRADRALRGEEEPEEPGEFSAEEGLIRGPREARPRLRVQPKGPGAASEKWVCPGPAATKGPGTPDEQQQALDRARREAQAARYRANQAQMEADDATQQAEGLTGYAEQLEARAREAQRSYETIAPQLQSEEARADFRRQVEAAEAEAQRVRSEAEEAVRRARELRVRASEARREADEAQRRYEAAERAATGGAPHD